MVSTCLPPMWPLFVSWHRRHMWVEFVVGSLPCSEMVFLRVLQFSPLLKNQYFQIPFRSGMHRHISMSSQELLSAPQVNKLQSHFFFYDLLSPSWCNLILRLRVQNKVKNKFFDYSLFCFPFSQTCRLEGFVHIV